MLKVVVHYLVKGKPERYSLILLLSKFLREKYSNLMKIDEELFSTDFMKQMSKIWSKKKDKEITYSSLPVETLSPILYLICRVIKPKVVVETGVKSGFSSAFILKALEDNSYGRLYSIEKRDKIRVTPQEKDIGWAIPNSLRNKWQLIIGSSGDKLQPLLDNLKSIDVFFHDSLHTYENMLFEYHTAWPYIKKDGFLMSDDVNFNDAFTEFVKETHSENLILANRMGVIVKSG
jgi:predicted O-methyltransferase YrrM